MGCPQKAHQGRAHRFFQTQINQHHPTPPRLRFLVYLPQVASVQYVPDGQPTEKSRVCEGGSSGAYIAPTGRMPHMYIHANSSSSCGRASHSCVATSAGSSKSCNPRQIHNMCTSSAGANPHRPHAALAPGLHAALRAGAAMLLPENPRKAWPTWAHNTSICGATCQRPGEGQCQGPPHRGTGQPWPKSACGHPRTQKMKAARSLFVIPEVLVNTKPFPPILSQGGNQSSRVPENSA